MVVNSLPIYPSQERVFLSEERYRLLFDANPLPMWLFDAETYRFLEVNQAAIEKYGYSRQEFLQMTILDIRPHEDVERLREGLQTHQGLHAGQAAIAIDNASLFNSLQRSNAELTQSYDTTLEGWSAALDLRDKETEVHTQRVTDMTVQLSQAMGLSPEEMVHVRRGALLHDIGKMGIPDHTLLNPDKLTDEEWEIMRKHPTYAYNLLKPIAYLRSALDIPYCHHEK